MSGLYTPANKLELSNQTEEDKKEMYKDMIQHVKDICNKRRKASGQ